MKKLLTTLSIFFLYTTWSFAQCTATVGSSCDLTADGTITIPAGVTMIEVKAWGAGGGSTSGANNRRAGGGGGAYFSAIYTVAPGQIVTATIGLGATGANGGNTVFDVNGGASVTVNGGIVGNSGVGGAGGTGGTVDGGAGGDRGSGANGTGGGGGGSGPGATAGSKGTATGGAGGTSGGGVGGNMGAGGADGTAPGGGGGGQGTLTSGIALNSAGGNGQVTVCVTAIALPVELIRFNANTKDNQILLEWQTASEENNEGFEIQKSKDGISWDILEFVEGNGTTLESNTYKSTDKFPIQGSNYYRLKQVDFDGNFEYSKVVSVDFNNRRNEVEMFPNPAKEQLMLINGKGEATIYNVLGNPVKQLTITAEQATIELTDLLDGQYYLQVIQENRTIVTKQFSKMD